MPKKLFISNLDFDVSGEQLNERFAEIGGVVSAVVALDRETKRSKGFAFVEMESDELADKAIELLNGKVVGGRPIKVVVDRGKTAPREGGEGGFGGEGAPRREFLPSIQRTQLFRRKKKVDPYLQDPNKLIDYKDISTLGRFLSERGKILSRRLTGLNAFNQRKVAKAVKRAQSLGLLPYTSINK